MSAAKAPTVRVVVNGEDRQVAAGTTVAELVARYTRSPKGVAVAINAAVVPRAQWEATTLDPGGTVEILTAIQGG